LETTFAPFSCGHGVPLNSALKTKPISDKQPSFLSSVYQTGDDKGLEVCSLVAAALFNGDALGRLGQVTHTVNRASLDLVGRD
jgi:hypothetical protein